MKSVIVISLILAMSMASIVPVIQPLQSGSVQEFFYNNKIIKCLADTHESIQAISTLISDLKNHNNTLPYRATELLTTYNTLVINLFDCGLIKGDKAPVIENPAQVQYCFNDINDLLTALKEFPALFKPSNFSLQYILHVVQGLGMVFDYVLNDCYLFQPSYKQ